jgi:hypothetical protein
MQGAHTFQTLKAALGQGITFVMLLITHYIGEHSVVHKKSPLNPNVVVTGYIEHFIIALHPN